LFGGLLTFPLGVYHSSELQYLFPGIDVFGLSVTLSSQQTGSADPVNHLKQTKLQKDARSHANRSHNRRCSDHR
jgi:hypothetical protein